MHIQNALKAHAGDLAYLINLAGEGIPEYLWQRMAESGEAPLEVGARRAARDEGNFSYLNARICVEHGALLGMSLCYRLPNCCEASEVSDYPDIVQPLVQLEARVPGSFYINAIATYEAHRGKGVGRSLMKDAEVRARSAGCDTLSLIVASRNTGATRLYEYLGYRAIASIPVVPCAGGIQGGEWLLMVKRLVDG